MPPRAGVLYLIATPIGNLEDITARALRLLGEVAVIAAEDTRVTRKLLAHFDIHTPLVSYHAHSTAGRQDALIARLLAGESVALVSDAGTPCVSDPGAELVVEAIAAGIRIDPIPGASAPLCALIASGLPPGRFVFEGFLPRTKPDFRERVRLVAREERTVVLFEAPPRLVETLKALAAACGDDRPASVGRELTKKFEEHVRGSLAEVIAHFTQTPARGECVIVLGGAPPQPEAEPDADALLTQALDEGLSPKDAARRIADSTGLAKNALYRRALELR
ncbi:16S rRNA (cytidine(1402)-2'-O)-methyltransferase [Armatimonas rosea]|uniref:Ribosomal RNA small subunit methyltransferase I n=1 Tax=Armatimonas rosea TaxID=685828 RepID=A0A7W9SLH2_ARMRO|nr:16S rRNA (cytidine(1402)-2'-O)-methyltransferase [Armatimonas rosea]MBB6048836.1 16S rRNA (cytidine1402-2'-O)-methyltransferase [Armatimonas rosea]